MYSLYSKKTRRNPSKHVARKPVTVKGSRSLGLDLQQWHASMSDPVYGVGSFFYAGQAVPIERAEAALANLRRTLKDDDAYRAAGSDRALESEDVSHLKKTIAKLGSLIDRKRPRSNPGKTTKRKYVPMDVTPMPASKKLRAKRRVNRIVPSPSTPETRARAKERAAKSKVIGKLFSAGNAKMAMKLARGQITIAQGRNAL